MPVPSGPLQMPPKPVLLGLLAALCALAGVAAWLLQAGPAAPPAPSIDAPAVAAKPLTPTPTGRDSPVARDTPLRPLGLLPAPTPLQVGDQVLQSWPPQRGGAAAVLWLVPVGQPVEEALPLVSGLWQLRDAGHVLVPLPAAASEAETDAFVDAVRAALSSGWSAAPTRLAVVGARSGADAALRFVARHGDAATAVITPPRRWGPEIPISRLTLVFAPFESAAATRSQFAGSSLVQVRSLAKKQGPREDDWAVLLSQRSDVLGWLVATLGPLQ